MRQFMTYNADETQRLGRLLGEVVPPGTFFALIGEMGAGKTHLVQGLAAGLGVTDRITSPTFTLVNEYGGGRLPLVHMDLFRLVSEDDIVERGIEEYLTAEAVALVEWPEVMGSYMPEQRVEIRLARQFDEGQEDWRSVEIAAVGGVDDKWIEEALGRYADIGI